MTTGKVKTIRTWMDDFWANYYRYGPEVRDGLGPCWLWTDEKDKDGYGRYWLDGKYVAAHRLSFKLTYGDPPKGHHVMHRCDNPPCGNPKHLTHGTNEDNLKDMAEKGRARGGRRTKDGREPKNRRSGEGDAMGGVE